MTPIYLSQGKLSFSKQITVTDLNDLITVKSHILNMNIKDLYRYYQSGVLLRFAVTFNDHKNYIYDFSTPKIEDSNGI